ncbi:MAG: T9SS type A sorting domain-containing protein [Candidatus Cloacimonetes bacterium]|nr:T9SS type A sorting domain-containing protein [Candidatus Cloacimonadota bacterium]
MKNIFLLLALLGLTAYLSAFEICGDIKSWQKEDFCGFDKVGDCTGECGDITSLFSGIENEKLYVRISFDDMVKRDGVSFVKDNFSNHNMKIVFSVLSKKDSNNVFASRIIDLRNKKFNIDRWRILRTPENNLLELAIPWKNHSISKEELLFTIKILLDGKIVDTFTEDGSRGSTGNCAFVHHGNQGLTYTEVFYGQDPPETSGYDEVLEVHQATDVPGNFHMSGTLMPAAEWHNPEFNDWLADGVTEGWVAMLTSAFGQHIMPFLNDNMNNWSVAVECDMVEYLYNYVPHIAWVPERVWLSQGYYPDAGLSDPWLGDNWTQHGVEAVILDDWPHCSGYSNSKIHWMNNGSGITLRVIPINNEFVGKFWNDPDGAKNMIANTGQYGIIVYGTDWEVAAEMNEHHNTYLLDNYESVIWYCHDNYPAIEAWKLGQALDNTDFNGSEIDIVNGTYAMLGGTDGYGGGNNSWYIDWAGCESHSDFHTPKWNYGFIWDDAYNNLMTAPDNALSQLGWYTMMINLHETGWHTGGEIADWEHRYSSHIKNANVFAEASRWANGDYTTTTSAYFSDIDRDGVGELIMYNDKAFFVFEEIGGKANWIFCKDSEGNAYSVVGSDVAYWSETDGDYNESSNNHVAALSDVSPNYQHDIYDISIDITTEDSIQATLTRYGVSKTVQLKTGNQYIEVTYNFGNETGYVKSGWTPGLLDLIWSGKSHLQRMWGDGGEYCGQRNSSSGATVALVLGDAGASHNLEFEGTLVKGDEIYGQGGFVIRLYAGYTSEPYDPSNNKVVELDSLAAEMLDDLAPRIIDGIAYLVGESKLQIIFSEALNETTAEDIANYEFQSFIGNYTLANAVLSHIRKVTLTINETFLPNDCGNVIVSNVEDLHGNVIDPDYNTATVTEIVTPHIVGTMNGWDPANHDYDFILNNNGIWEVVINLSAGTHEYKVIESDAWDGNDWPNTNQIIILTEETDVTFLANCGLVIGTRNYDEFVTHCNPVIAGDFLSELGGTDWDPTCLVGEMADIDTNGIFEWQVLVPQGDWEYKVTLNHNWDQDTQGSAGNFYFNSNGQDSTLFTYDMSQNITSADTVGGGAGISDNANVIFEDLFSNYPNPFQQITSIKFDIKSSGKVRIDVYNIKGQLVKTLINRKVEVGQHIIIWDGTNEQGISLSSGIYLCKMKTKDYTTVRKIILLK